MSNQNNMFQPWQFTKADHEAIGDSTDIVQLSSDYLTYYEDTYKMFVGITEAVRAVLKNGKIGPDSLKLAKSYTSRGSLAMKIRWTPVYPIKRGEPDFNPQEAEAVKHDYIELNVFAYGSRGNYVYQAGVGMQNENNKMVGVIPDGSSASYKSMKAPDWFYSELKKLLKDQA